MMEKAGIPACWIVAKISPLYKKAPRALSWTQGTIARLQFCQCFGRVGFGAGLYWGHLFCGLCEVGQRDSVWASRATSPALSKRYVAEVCVNKFANVIVVDLAVRREGVSCNVFITENVVYDIWTEVPLGAVRSWRPRMFQLKRVFVMQAISIGREWAGWLRRERASSMILRCASPAAKLVFAKSVIMRLHAAFINFKQAYDTIPKEALWSHFQRMRMPTCLLAII
eukprot:1157915-Pelagomonas_calceolata.AAC.3